MRCGMYEVTGEGEQQIINGTTFFVGWVCACVLDWSNLVALVILGASAVVSLVGSILDTQADHLISR